MASSVLIHFGSGATLTSGTAASTDAIIGSIAAIAASIGVPSVTVVAVTNATVSGLSAVASTVSIPSVSVVAASQGAGGAFVESFGEGY